MKSSTKKLLLEVDCAKGWEDPETYRLDYDAIWSDIYELQTQLEAVVGEPFNIDEYVQDASFITDLYIDPQPSEAHGGHMLVRNLAIRFSAFGRLYTIMASEKWLQESGVELDRIINEVESKGFQYVEADELEEPYDGKNEEMQRNATSYTWWLRYFDYL